MAADDNDAPGFALHWAGMHVRRIATHCNTLQNAATHCNSLQHADDSDAPGFALDWAGMHV